jgi:putative endonuclease
MYKVYILECADKTLYVGSTSDLKRRLVEHNNSKKGAHYTKIRRPVVLVYSEDMPNLSLALKREIEIKRWTRIKKMKLVNNKQKS